MQIGVWLAGASTLMLDFRSTANRFAQLRDVVRPDLVVCTRRINATQGLDAVLLSAGKPGGNPAQLLPVKLPLGLVADHIATSDPKFLTAQPRVGAL